MKKVTVVTDVSGDWQGVYLGNELVIENHQLDIFNVLDSIGLKYDHIEVVVPGTLPETLKEAKNLPISEEEIE